MAEKIDISTHIFVPKHVKVNENEANKILEKYNVSIKQLPKILINDPALHGLNAKVGEIIKIERKSPTAGEFDFFRVVVGLKNE